MSNYYQRPTVRSSKALIISATVFIFIVTTLTGCLDAMHDVYVSAFPTFEETESAWPDVENGGIYYS